MQYRPLLCSDHPYSPGSYPDNAIQNNPLEALGRPLGCLLADKVVTCVGGPVAFDKVISQLRGYKQGLYAIRRLGMHSRAIP